MQVPVLQLAVMMSPIRWILLFDGEPACRPWLFWWQHLACPRANTHACSLFALVLPSLARVRAPGLLPQSAGPGPVLPVRQVCHAAERPAAGAAERRHAGGRGAHGRAAPRLAGAGGCGQEWPGCAARWLIVCGCVMCGAGARGALAPVDRHTAANALLGALAACRDACHAPDPRPRLSAAWLAGQRPRAGCAGPCDAALHGAGARGTQAAARPLLCPAVGLFCWPAAVACLCSAP